MTNRSQMQFPTTYCEFRILRFQTFKISAERPFFEVFFSGKFFSGFFKSTQNRSQDKKKISRTGRKKNFFFLPRTFFAQKFFPSAQIHFTHLSSQLSKIFFSKDIPKPSTSQKVQTIGKGRTDTQLELLGFGLRKARDPVSHGPLHCPSPS